MATTVSDSQLEFDLGENETATDISISEDGKAQIADPTPAPQVIEDSQSSNREELDAVSEGVQKRIAKLTAK